MMPNENDGSTLFCTMGGTLMAIWTGTEGWNPMETVLSAALGAAVSFAVTLLLKGMVRRKD